jgi:pantetheine-phosphate adenylyltransferase
MKRGLYAGSFDPITRGHIDIVKKALETFDVVHIACAANSTKKRLFSLSEAHALMVASLSEGLGFDIDWEEIFEFQITNGVPGPCGISTVVVLDGRLEIGYYASGTIIQHARKIEASHLIRGLRQVSDFNDEFTMHGIIERAAPDLTMTHFISRSEFLHVSSSTARELARYNSDVDWLVTPTVAKAMAAKFSQTV